jgi:cytidylate kinase
MPHSPHLSEATFRPVFGSVQSVSVPAKWGRGEAAPFITISRQAGAGAKVWAEMLIQRLNAVESSLAPNATAEDVPQWTAWDRELVEKVATDLGTSKELIDGLTDANRNWLDRFFDDIYSSYEHHHASEFAIYRRVASTVAAMAQRGRVIIVGRGGAYITSGMPGGLHLRLVAPLKDRIANIEKRLGYSHKKAVEYVTTTDRARDKFCREHFGNAAFAPETFDITFNTSTVSIEQMIECIVACMRIRK